MSSSIGADLRVTGYWSQGGRKYMEDFVSVAYEQTDDERGLEYAFCGIYDGHGGCEAAKFAKEHLMLSIVSDKLFWSDSDQDVLRAIREGYIRTHYEMWRVQDRWPKTSTGRPSTAGTTASVAFLRRGKIYIGHVGDSRIVLGHQVEGEKHWRAKSLTADHKPECSIEKERIVNCGGKVITKSGVPRVVWNRPRIGHKGPVRRSTPIDEIPFLAVARSLGDLWSYNPSTDTFIVSPNPDVKVFKIDPKIYRCLIFGTDGLWNVVSPNDAVNIVHEAEIFRQRLGDNAHAVEEKPDWMNPSKCLVDKALECWSRKKWRADNTSVVTIMLDSLASLTSEDEITKNDDTIDMSLHGVSSKNDNASRAAHLSLPDGFEQNIIRNRGGFCDDVRKDNDRINFNYFHASRSSSLHNQEQLIYPQEFSITESNLPADRDYTDNERASTSYGVPGSDGNNSSSFTDSYSSPLIISLAQQDKHRPRGPQNLNLVEKDYYNSLGDNILLGVDDDDRRLDFESPSNILQHHNHQMQQMQYQQQCMTGDEGYRLTKLETRGEQQFKSLRLQQNFHSQQNLLGFDEDYSINDQYSNAKSTPYNSNLCDFVHLDGTSPAVTIYTLPHNSRLENSEFDGDRQKRYNANCSQIYNPDDSMQSNYSNYKPEESFVGSRLDESIQINEISSSVIDLYQTPSTSQPTTLKTKHKSVEFPDCVSLSSRNENDVYNRVSKELQSSIEIDNFKTNTKEAPSQSTINISISKLHTASSTAIGTPRSRRNAIAVKNNTRSKDQIQNECESESICLRNGKLIRSKQSVTRQNLQNNCCRSKIISGKAAARVKASTSQRQLSSSLSSSNAERMSLRSRCNRLSTDVKLDESNILIKVTRSRRITIAAAAKMAKPLAASRNITNNSSDLSNAKVPKHQSLPRNTRKTIKRSKFLSQQKQGLSALRGGKA